MDTPTNPQFEEFLRLSPLTKDQVNSNRDFVYKIWQAAVASAAMPTPPEPEPQPIYEVTIRWKNKQSAEWFLEGGPDDKAITSWKRTAPDFIGKITTIIPGTIPENLWEIVSENAGDQLTKRKTEHIIRNYGYTVSGYVLRNENDEVCISEGAVRWLSNAEMHNLMHNDFKNEDFVDKFRKIAGALTQARFCIRELLYNDPDGKYTIDIINAALELLPKE